MKNRVWKTLISLLLCVSCLTVLLCPTCVLADQIPDKVKAGSRGCKLRSSPEVPSNPEKADNLIIKVHAGSLIDR